MTGCKASDSRSKSLSAQVAPASREECSSRFEFAGFCPALISVSSSLHERATMSQKFLLLLLLNPPIYLIGTERRTLARVPDETTPFSPSLEPRQGRIDRVAGHIRQLPFGLCAAVAVGLRCQIQKVLRRQPQWQTGGLRKSDRGGAPAGQSVANISHQASRAILL